MKLTAEQLTFERNDAPLLNAVHFNLHSGELLQVQGANGSGKSTLLRILAGFIEPQQGKICWNDACLLTQRDHYQTQVHYIGHQNGIKPYLTVIENLQLYDAIFHHVSSTQHLHAVINQIGLSTLVNTPAFTLSAGQARRVALAKLLLRPCMLWILDEPTTALDTSGQQLFSQLLNLHLENGGMAIVATHHDFQISHPTQLLTLNHAHGVSYG